MLPSDFVSQKLGKFGIIPETLPNKFVVRASKLRLSFNGEALLLVIMNQDTKCFEVSISLRTGLGSHQLVNMLWGNTSTFVVQN